MTESGKIVCKPYKKNVVHERQKLKSFKIKVNNKEMYASDIENIYKSWRGSIRKYNSYHNQKAYRLRCMCPKGL